MEFSRVWFSWFLLFLHIISKTTLIQFVAVCTEMLHSRLNQSDIPGRIRSDPVHTQPGTMVVGSKGTASTTAYLRSGRLHRASLLFLSFFLIRRVCVRAHFMRTRVILLNFPSL